MKKKLAAFACAFFLSFSMGSAFAELVSWKGMEHDIGPRPKWLFKYVKSRNEKQIRNRFDLAPSSSVVLGVGRAESLETARAASQADAQRLGADKGLGNLSPLYEYWEEDSEKGFAVYSLYGAN